MTDQWGRPDMSDGLEIAKAVQWLRNNEAQTQDRQSVQQAYQVADAMAKKQDTSQFNPQARFMGSKLYWDNRLTQTKAQMEEYHQSTEAMQNTMTRLDLNLKVAAERLRQYDTARRMGDDKRAKEIAVILNNENMYNGRYVKSDNANGGYEVTNWDGKNEHIDDMPIEKVDQLIGAYFNKSYDDIMKWQLSAEEMRRKRNFEILGKAQAGVNDQGETIYKVPAGLWGPDGRPRGSYYVASPDDDKELPPERSKGFMTFEDALKKANIIKARSKEPINPENVVTSGGSQGLIVPGAAGNPEFKPIQGSGGGKINLPPGKGGAKSDYDLKVKQLETELMPFVEKGQSVIDPQTLAITNNGNNALKTAMSIVQKNEQDPKQLSDAEKKLLPNAQRAVAMYQQLSQMNAQSYGLQTQQGMSEQGTSVNDLLQGYIQKGRQAMGTGQK